MQALWPCRKGKVRGSDSVRNYVCVLLLCMCLTDSLLCMYVHGLPLPCACEYVVPEREKAVCERELLRSWTALPLAV